MDTCIIKIRQAQTVQLNSPITCIASCQEHISIGCLNDTLRVWPLKYPLTKQPSLSHNESISCIIDIAFMKSSTHLASLSMDSRVQIWDLDTRVMQCMEVPMFSAWRVVFVGDTIITCGDFGRVLHYDLFSREIIKKFDFGDYFLTALTKSEQIKRIATGNTNGDIYLLSAQTRQQPIHIHPHNKSILSLAFTNNTTQLYTSSTDKTISNIDLTKLIPVRIYEGHEQKVTSIKIHPQNQYILYSGSADHCVRVWDQRCKYSVGKLDCATAINCIDIVGKSLVIGGDNGLLQFANL